jgi:hypothetical protein
MNKVILQFWEESVRGYDTRPFGCSLHLDNKSRDNYVDSNYKSREVDYIPSEYDRTIGDPIEAYISDVLYSKVKLNTTLRVYEHELNNLMSMAEIIIRNDE